MRTCVDVYGRPPAVLKTAFETCGDVRKGPLPIEISKRDSTAIRSRVPASTKLAVILAVARAGPWDS